MHARTYAFGLFAVHVVATVAARLALRVTMLHTIDAAFGHSIGTRAHLHCTAATQTQDTRDLALCVCEAFGGDLFAP